MEITKQEKINLCLLYLVTYENLNDLIESFNPIFNDMYRGSNDIDINITNDIRKDFNKCPDNKNNKNQSLNNNEVQELLIKLNFIKKDDIDKFRSLAKTRCEIAHETGRILFDENIDLEYFKLEELLKLYVSMFGSVSTEFLKENINEKQSIIQTYLVNVGGLQIMCRDLLKDKKFEHLIKILEEPYEF